MKIYRHKATGGIYQVICEAVMEKEGIQVHVYMDCARDSGRIWVRPSEEFRERFEELVGPKEIPCLTMQLRDLEP